MTFWVVATRSPQMFTNIPEEYNAYVIRVEKKQVGTYVSESNHKIILSFLK
jgi:hypothetical protein